MEPGIRTFTTIFGACRWPLVPYPCAPSASGSEHRINTLSYPNPPPRRGWILIPSPIPISIPIPSPIPKPPPPAGQAGDFFHANTILWDLHDANGASVYVALRHVGTLLKIRRATALAGALDTLLRLTGSHGPI